MPSTDKMHEVFLSHGERFGFILVIILGLSFFFIQKTPTAFSETLNQEPEQVERYSNQPSQTATKKNQTVESAAFVKQQISPTATLTPTISLTPTNTPSPIPTTTPSPTQTPSATPTPSLVPASPTPTAIPTPQPISVDPNSEEIWEKIAECESHKNWSINTGNGYFGGLQFSQGAWESVGGSGNPAAASREEQIMRGKMLQQARGWGVWGMCSKQLGLN